MNIEDIIVGLDSWQNSIKFSPQESNFISSIGNHINQKGLTARQRTAILKLFTKYSGPLSDHFKIDVYSLVQNPVFRTPLREASNNVNRNISIVSINNEKKIVVKFPFDEELVGQIRQYKNLQLPSRNHWATWNPDQFEWEFKLNEPNLLFVSGFEKLGFSVDYEFSEYVSKLNEVVCNIDSYIPMVEFRDGRFFYKNVVDTIPQPTSTDLLTVLFHARSYGITCWDDAIELALSSNKINPITSHLLKNTTGIPTVIHGSSEVLLEDLSEVISYSENVLFIIPGGSELPHVSKVHQYLISDNYTNEQMSVLFRLNNSSDSGVKFNEYITNNHLNNHLLKRVKFYFISGSVQRPLIEANKKFDLIVHFGTNSAHYTLKTLIKNNHNVISMSLHNIRRDSNLANV